MSCINCTISYEPVHDLEKKIRMWNDEYNNLEHISLIGKTPNEMVLNFLDRFNSKPPYVCSQNISLDFVFLFSIINNRYFKRGIEMTNDLTLSVENVDFQPTFINQKSKEVQLSMTIGNGFKIPNIVISFEEDLKQNWPWAPVEISRNKELFPYFEDLVSERLLTDKKLISPLKNLLEEEIDILPFGMISKKVDNTTLIPIDCIEIDDIEFCGDLFIQRIGLGHYLTFYNQWLCNINGKYILDPERCLIKNVKIVSVINELLCVKNFQERANQAFKQKRSKFFYLGIEFKHQKSPLVFS